MIKSIKYFLLGLAILAMSGCMSNIEGVKNSHLSGYEQTTIGNAFEAFFSNPKWEEHETANKTKFVEFRGITKSNIPDLEFPAIAILDNTEVIIQFTVKVDDTFKITAMSAERGMIIEDKFLLSLAYLTGKIPVGQKSGRYNPNILEQKVLLDIIYANNLAPAPVVVATPEPVVAPVTTPEPVAAPLVVEAPPTTQAAEAAPMTNNFSPSFDCSKASTGQERLICGSRELSSLDVKLSLVYRQALEAAIDKDALRDSQRNWRKFERDSCSDAQCLTARYDERIADLMSNAKTSAAPEKMVFTKSKFGATVLSSGPEVNNKNLVEVLSALEKKANSYGHGSHDWESNLKLTLSVIKDETPGAGDLSYVVTGIKIPRGYRQVIFSCGEHRGNGSMLRTLPASEKRRIVYAEKWSGFTDTETGPSMKPSYIIQADVCEEGAPD